MVSSVAMATKENLTTQRGVFGNIGGRLSGMTSILNEWLPADIVW